MKYPVSPLVLNFYDSQNHQLVWDSVPSESPSSSPEKNKKKLNKAVDKMLEHFPPSEKG